MTDYVALDATTTAETPCMRACGHFGPHLPETLSGFVYPSDFCGEPSHHPAVLERAVPEALSAFRKVLATQHCRVENVTQDGDDWWGCLCGEPNDDCVALALIEQHRSQVDSE